MIWITSAVVIIFGIFGQGDAFVQHLTVPLVDHVFADSIQGIEGFATIIAPQANEVVGHLLAQIVKQALDVRAVFGVGNEERMCERHVFEVRHHILALVITEEAVALGQRILGYFIPFIRIDLQISSGV